jgi:hypothetical protein
MSRCCRSAEDIPAGNLVIWDFVMDQHKRLNRGLLGHVHTKTCCDIFGNNDQLLRYHLWSLKPDEMVVETVVNCMFDMYQVQICSVCVCVCV